MPREALQKAEARLVIQALRRLRNFTWAYPVVMIFTIIEAIGTGVCGSLLLDGWGRGAPLPAFLWDMHSSLLGAMVGILICTVIQKVTLLSCMVRQRETDRLIVKMAEDRA